MKDIKQLLALLVVAVFCVGVVSGATSQKRTPDQIKKESDKAAAKKIADEAAAKSIVIGQRKTVETAPKTEDVPKTGWTSAKPLETATRGDIEIGQKKEAESTQKTFMTKIKDGFANFKEKVTGPVKDIQAAKTVKDLGSLGVRTEEDQKKFEEAQARVEKSFIGKISVMSTKITDQLKNLPNSIKSPENYKNVTKTVDDVVGGIKSFTTAARDNIKEGTPKMLTSVMSQCSKIRNSLNSAILKVAGNIPAVRKLLVAKFETNLTNLNAANKLAIDSFDLKNLPNTLSTKIEHLQAMDAVIRSPISTKLGLEQLKGEGDYSIDSIKASRDGVETTVKDLIAMAKEEQSTLAKERATLIADRDAGGLPKDLARLDQVNKELPKLGESIKAAENALIPPTTRLAQTKAQLKKVGVQMKTAVAQFKKDHALEINIFKKAIQGAPASIKNAANSMGNGISQRIEAIRKEITTDLEKGTNKTAGKIAELETFVNTQKSKFENASDSVKNAAQRMFNKAFGAITGIKGLGQDRVTSIKDVNWTVGVIRDEQVEKSPVVIGIRDFETASTPKTGPSGPAPKAPETLPLDKDLADYGA